MTKPSPRRSRPHIALRHPVAYPLPSPVKLRVFLLLPAAAGILLGFAWLHLSRPAVWQIGALAAALLLATCAAWWLHLWGKGDFLRWTGTRWSLIAAEPEEGVLSAMVVAMDGQTWLLVRAEWAAPTKKMQPRWLLLVRASLPERWPDIRRVLYSSLAADSP